MCIRDRHSLNDCWQLLPSKKKYLLFQSLFSYMYELRFITIASHSSVSVPGALSMVSLRNRVYCFETARSRHIIRKKGVKDNHKSITCKSGKDKTCYWLISTKHWAATIILADLKSEGLANLIAEPNKEISKDVLWQCDVFEIQHIETIICLRSFHLGSWCLSY